MIETLILGIVLGAISAVAGLIYGFYRYIKRPYVIKSFSDDYEIIAIDREFEHDNYHYVAIKKVDKIIAAIKLDKNGIKEVVYDV